MGEGENLLPCPVCGETPDGIVDATKALGVYRIIHRCKVWPTITVQGYSIRQVVAEWNTRAPAPQGEG